MVENAVSRKQEPRLLAVDFLPCARLRPDKTKAAAPTNKRVVVYLSASEEEFTCWVTPSYTFADLRRDAARFWRLSHRYNPTYRVWPGRRAELIAAAQVPIH